MKLINIGLDNVNSNTAINNCVCMIPVEEIQGDILYYAPHEIDYFVIGGTYFNKLHIQLVDYQNNIISLNGIKLLFRS